VKTLEAFLFALSIMESDGNYQAVNTLNYLGAYQFGEAALTDLGFVRYDGDASNNDFSGGWTGKHGVRSARDFLESPRAQDLAVREWVELMWHYIELQDLDSYAWSEVGGVTLTPSGMLAAVHLLGPDSLAQFVSSDGAKDPRDPYGTPISSYMVRLADYEIPFAPKAARRVASASGS
jgi:hypothetical protein